MTGLRRGMKKIWYCLYQGMRSLPDEEGRDVGEYAPIFGLPVEMTASVSPAAGRVDLERFGLYGNYDRVIRTHDRSCPVDEKTVFFIDREPAFDADGLPLYDYVAVLVSRSPNVTEIAVKKVARNDETAV